MAVAIFPPRIFTLVVSTLLSYERLDDKKLCLQHIQLVMSHLD